ncbi:MAG: UTP--glucose-1-phosphate uridylyltransferase [Deltaproteobacteria bacterium]|nr:UTP--glucose-1-phosphate uridylyltransferase [Deltaproteobacteria bacterium]
MKHLSSFISKMEKEGLSPMVIDTFSYYYKKVVEGETGLVFDRDIDPVHKDEIKDANNLGSWTAAGKKAFKHAVRITLNGGLGTSMGLTGPKSLIKVKDGKTFLEIILQQAEHCNVKLALMNSFSTHEDTLLALSKIDPPGFPLVFLQHKFPKILQEGLSPATWPKKHELEWNPPGHGDVYTALYTSGMLKTLLDEEITYAFISNSDNLGAGMDASLLGYFSENKFPFMMEVAQKTPADLKGGHLARQKNGRLILREVAQCHENELSAFEDIRRYRFFNTNNIWINLKFLNDLIKKEKTIRLPMILNPKTLDPRNERSPGVFQVETAMGAAISLFEGATAVKVPRSRFFPVKKCNDLLAVRSDCFVFSKEKNLMVNPAGILKNKSDTIKIDLDPKYYGKIDLLEERFKDGVPSLVDCESLAIEGDVFFQKNVTLKGEVKIKNSKKSRADIKEGSIIEGDLTL